MNALKIQVLERHAQSIRMVLILYEVGSLNFQAFIDDYSISSATLYRTLDALKGAGIVVSRDDISSYPKRTVLSLSKMGKVVAEHLKEIEKILER